MKESFKELFYKNYLLEALKEDVTDLINENESLKSKTPKFELEQKVYVIDDDSKIVSCEIFEIKKMCDDKDFKYIALPINYYLEKEEIFETKQDALKFLKNKKEGK